jgi:alanine dehydrogenase
MRIGIPKEIKVLEGRVGLVPEACAMLVQDGHTVLLEKGAGLLSGYSDEQYTSIGAELVEDAEALYGSANMIIKVKEPLGPELDLLRKEHLLFCYLHLAANPELAARLQEIGLTAIAFETVVESGLLPLLAPMSDIAGRLATQIGSNLLYQHNGGRGVLLGGVPAAERGKVVILGAGVAGSGAAMVATGLGAEVTVFDRKRSKLERMRSLGNNVTALYPYHHAVHDALKTTDLLVGAVLVAGAKTPHIVSEDMVRSMQAGSVIVDISVDQGGCVETTHPTSYAEPTYIWEDVVHFAVTNMPGAVPRTASQTLSAALIPYAHQIAAGDWEKDAGIQAGVNVRDGKIVHSAVADALAP